jgi:hypothetical protein
MRPLQYGNYTKNLRFGQLKDKDQDLYPANNVPDPTKKFWSGSATLFFAQ